MIPTPSKLPFGNPLPAIALDYFCHPSREGFTKPVRHPDGTLYAASGYIALRARRGYWLDSDYEHASPEFVDRVAKLPWSQFETYGTTGEWRPLEEIRSALFRFGTDPLWHGFNSHTADKLVVIGGAPAFPIAVLQLVSRLPRAEVCLSGTTVTSPVLFRFTGGEGIIPCHFPNLAQAPPPVLHCLRPKQASLPGGLV